MRRRLAAWGPALVWSVLIFTMSTDAFSGANTGYLLEPIVRLLVPDVSPQALELVHFSVRKLAHVTEYLVFAILLDRGFREESPISPARAPLAALVVAAIYSLSDEGHQSFVASRGASLYDCGVDFFGAAIGALVAAYRAQR